MLLGDLGARVVKVEHPDGGDVTRGWGPPWEATTGLSAYYLAVNRNKESIALDLSTEVGAESVRILARRADVLVENFLPGDLEKLGLPLGSEPSSKQPEFGSSRLRSAWTGARRRSDFRRSSTRTVSRFARNSGSHSRRHSEARRAEESLP